MIMNNYNNFSQSINAEELSVMLSKQINNFIPDNCSVSSQDLILYCQSALKRIFNCFRWINNKYYNDGKNILFNHLQSDHYCSFLYLVSNSAHQNRADDLATKLFLLNKYLHSIDLYYSVKLPEVFMLVHPVGSVIGNAEYSNFFVAYQNCTIGSVYKDGRYIYPRFKENVVLYARSCVIGDCDINEHVIVGANSFIINTNVPSHSIVTGAYPHLVISQKKSVEIPFFHK